MDLRLVSRDPQRSQHLHDLGREREASALQPGTAAEQRERPGCALGMDARRRKPHAFRRTQRMEPNGKRSRAARRARERRAPPQPASSITAERCDTEGESSLFRPNWTAIFPPSPTPRPRWSHHAEGVSPAVGGPR